MNRRNENSALREEEPWNRGWVMATGFHAKMLTFSFIVALVIVKEVYSYIYALTVGLQGDQFNLFSHHFRFVFCFSAATAHS